jgi:hypothetical protein
LREFDELIRVDSGFLRPDLGKLGGIGLCRKFNFDRLRECGRRRTEPKAGAYQRWYNST